jgi:hypothetical protein
MGNFNIKSILLGIGIGIIITATVSIIYMSGRDPMKELTKQQIINQAEKYGMINAPVFQEGTASESTNIFKVPATGEK